MSLQTRVKTLETVTGGANCPECGWDGIAPLKPVISRREGDPKGDTYCGRCGRAIAITLTWGEQR